MCGPRSATAGARDRLNLARASLDLLRLSRPATGSLMCCTLIANTGYLGYPLAATAFGFDALSEVLPLIDLPDTYLLVAAMPCGIAWSTAIVAVGIVAGSLLL